MADLVPYRRLGNSGLIVSRIALGTMNFGDRTDEAEAGRIFGEAVEVGVNFIDTADSYAQGRSEEITGRLIASNRHRFVLATKLCNKQGDGPNERGLSRKWIMQETAASLRRLGTDFIDILYLHKEDVGTPIEETVRALADLIRQGAIRYFGISNFKAWRIATIARLCDEAGIDRPIVSQPLYHVLNRTAEIEQLPVCDALGIGVATYSPTARGVLTGKYRRDTPPPVDSRVGVKNRRILETEYHPANLDAAEKIAAYAQSRDVEPAAFAVAWVLANPIVSAAIAGPRTIDQWRIYLSGAQFAWTDADEVFVDEIVRPGVTCVPGYTDPSYPPEGRPTAADRAR